MPATAIDVRSMQRALQDMRANLDAFIGQLDVELLDLAHECRGASR
ncbi:hypothetical protein [Thiocapsa sp. UBA6158]|nr:hypothetical protein [Thiocapsa sp. UBA6158]